VTIGRLRRLVTARFMCEVEVELEKEPEKEM